MKQSEFYSWIQDSLNSIVKYSFQKFHTHDFIYSHNNLPSPPATLPLPFLLSPLVNTGLFSVSVSLLFLFVLFTSLLYSFRLHI